MKNYIPHPSDARIGSAVISLRIAEGSAGYGVYWMICELLRDADSYKIPADAKRISFAINEADFKLIDRVIHTPELFTIDEGGFLSCLWLNEAMGQYDERKKKLQEAGRRGAAKRFGHTDTEESQPKATPSNEQSQPKAYNPIEYDITKSNTTQHNASKAKDWRSVLDNGCTSIPSDFIDSIVVPAEEGHAVIFLAQACMKHKISLEAYNFIVEQSNRADINNSIYRRFCAIVSKMEREKYIPKYPSNFILSKIFDE